MSRDEITACVARRQSAWQNRDAASLTEDHTDDCVVESPLAGGETRGREAIEKLYATYFHAFTDIHLETNDLLIDGDRAALFAVASGTDRGGFMGMAPTGRPVRFAIVFMYEFKNGLIARERRVYDFTGLLVQVGMLKAKFA